MIELTHREFDPEIFPEDFIADTEARMLFPADERMQEFRRFAHQRRIVAERSQIHDLDLQDLSEFDRHTLIVGDEPKVQNDSPRVLTARLDGFIAASLVWFLLAARKAERQQRNRKVATLQLWLQWLDEHRQSLAARSPALKERPRTKPLFTRQTLFNLRTPRPPARETFPNWLRPHLRNFPTSERRLMTIRRSYLPVAHLWAAALNFNGSNTGMLGDPYQMPAMLQRAEWYRSAMVAEGLYAVALPNFDSNSLVRVSLDGFTQPKDDEAHRWFEIPDLPLAAISDSFLKRVDQTHNAKRLSKGSAAARSKL